MAIERGKIIAKDKVVMEGNERIDLILWPEGGEVMRVKVSKGNYKLLEGFNEGDNVEIEFCSPMRQIKRGGLIRRFDNNFLTKIRPDPKWQDLKNKD